MEAAIELVLFNERLNIDINYYRNRSSNQLVNYSLPSQTGFNNILRNFPALVENSGWELMIGGIILEKNSFNWQTNFNVTISDSQLLSFPGLEKSSYARFYEIGYPLDIYKTLSVLGVDPETGIYQLNSTNIVSDLTSINTVMPQYYGGFQNTINYRHLQLDFLFQFVKQNSLNYINGNNTPGSMYNQPDYVLRRWQKEGDISDIQRYSTLISTGDAGSVHRLYSLYSDARISDASYIRLKNISMYYTLPVNWFKKFNNTHVKVYLQGQNLLTITNYLGNDPENGSGNALPPLRTVVAGIQLTL